MKRMRRLAVGLLCALMTAMLIVPAAAHGCHGGRNRGHHSGYARNVQTTVTVCSYKDCAEAGRHTHNGVIYCGYSHDTGVCDNNCRALCPYEDCSETGRHLHDGTTYCGYDHSSGYCDGNCRALCPYENCNVAGRHTHYGTGYCGTHHDCGYCDSSCTVSASCGRGHHGGC